MAKATRESDDSDHHVAALLIIDVVTPLSRRHDGNFSPEAPAFVDNIHIYVLTARDGEPLGANDARLDLTAEPGDHVRIRAIPLALRGEHSVLLDGITHADAEVLSPFDLVLRGALTVATPNADNLLEPGGQSIDDYFWQSQVLAPGIAACTLEFVVWDKSSAVCGYFQCHLQINILGLGETS